ncbi:MAG: lipoyl domain-containing protein [Gammaproteobacteria bacterium]|jgi:pyruvate/2-oxoglutarate dehydrogenase complex dihydrolipoamide acyltransferase (E2) component|nr:lipoyl domain-containing protein [Gammaproteobacteria bacterium]MBU0786714.1 lipoyl domain-containing protein [Gammaproteobacteria bacterium]MBU0814080.1 lipoyl domain-containing protein [Gammaproteobacteria bacterium]MBU1788447.1 lipoyl domain-containing protein [Gammaproteobacteria bacterium]
MSAVSLNVDAWKDIDPATEALVDKWLVAEGAAVRAGQVLANVVLVKSNMDVVAPASGRLERILVKPGETFGKGKPIAELKESA